MHNYGRVKFNSFMCWWGHSKCAPKYFMFDLVQICNIFWLIGFCKTFILKKTHISTPMPVHVNNEKFQLCNLIRHIGVVICFFRKKTAHFTGI